MLGLATARRYGGEELLAAVRGLPADALPLLDPDADRILDHALTGLPSPDPDGLVPLRVLFGALLELSKEASRAIRRELAKRGVDTEAIIASYRDFLPYPGPYKAFLCERHRYCAARVEVPTYQADQPRSRRSPDADLIDIRGEVDAFAHLIAWRKLEPPLAVGLFGDWGSGKSFFLRSLQRRIDTLVNDPAAIRRPQGELPFYQHVVQIEFNAWQYVEGNLWASLAEHIFRNLRTSSDDDLVAERQRYWIEQLKVTDEQREALEKRRQALTAEIARLRENPLAGWKPELIDAVKDAVEGAGLATTATEVAQMRAALAEARDVLHQANPVLEPLRSGGWQPVAVVIAVLALIPALSWGLDQLNWSAVSNAAATLTSILASATACVKWGTSLVKDGLAKIARAEQELNTQLEQAEDELQRLAAQAAEVEAELAKITPASVLAEFLTERTGSDDYRRHLGVPALIRRDLERLSNLVDEQNRRLEDGAAPRDDEYPINRIVLYIDDLDRCPTQLVIEVLQAVHLLLAFPLFVVVVAVDARWLAGSLREHYGTLLGAGEAGATPDDYLEKIFQVPFWVQPLDPGVRRQLARGLLAPSLATVEAAAALGAAEPDQAQPESIEPVDRARFLALVNSFFDAEGSAQAWLEAAHLTVTEHELALIDEVALLLGDTPRSVKRFVNVYQLLKSMRAQRRPITGNAYPAVILLLAIATGLPDLARDLLPAIERHQDGPFSLVKIVAKLEVAPEHQREQLAAWLAEHPNYETLDLPDLPGWIALIRRFSFRLGGSDPLASQR